MELRPEPGAEPTRALWIAVAVLGLVGAAFIAVTAPLDRLLGTGAEAVRSAVHGLAAGVLMVTATIGVFQAYRMFLGRAGGLGEVQAGSVVNAIAAVVTVVSGNWLYIPYRSAAGPRQYFLQVNPDVHKVFFEFKEFAALFVVPLSVTAAYLLVRYGEDLARRRGLSTVVALLLVLVFFYFAVAFGLGAAITKLRSV